MSAIFGRGQANPIVKAVTENVPKAETAPTPEPTASAGLGAAPLQQQPTSRITNRASTMLSNRRAGDVPVGTKRLLGQ
jgi:hypothetical protein